MILRAGMSSRNSGAIRSCEEGQERGCLIYSCTGKTAGGLKTSFETPGLQRDGEALWEINSSWR